MDIILQILMISSHLSVTLTIPSEEHLNLFSLDNGIKFFRMSFQEYSSMTIRARKDAILPEKVERITVIVISLTICRQSSHYRFTPRSSSQSPLGKRGSLRVNISPVPAEGFYNPRNGLFDCLVQHQFPVHDKFFWHLVSILKTEHIGLGVF